MLDWVNWYFKEKPFSGFAGFGGGGTGLVLGGGVSNGMEASGGIINDYTHPGGNVYRAHTFSSSGTFTISAPGGLGDTVEYLVIAGGRSGGRYYRKIANGP